MIEAKHMDRIVRVTTKEKEVIEGEAVLFMPAYENESGENEIGIKVPPNIVAIPESDIESIEIIQ